jgi:excinuclease UvrABC ATPase subunit
MTEIKYSADEKAFPQLKNSNDTKSTAAETQGGMTTEVSAISDSIIHSAVKEAFDKLLTDHKEMERQWNLKFQTLETKMNDLSKSVAADVINAMLSSEQMPFLNKTEFYKQMNTQTMAMTSIMEQSNLQVNEIKTMFSSIQSSLHDGPAIDSPPRKIRLNRDIMLAETTADNSHPPTLEAAGSE